MNSCFIEWVSSNYWMILKFSLWLVVTMALPVVEFSRRTGIQNWKGFCIKINCSQMKLLNFENWTNGEPQ